MTNAGLLWYLDRVQPPNHTCFELGGILPGFLNVLVLLSQELISQTKHE